MRSEADFAKKNLELGFEFSRFILSNPEIEVKIPENAVLVFEVADDPELSQFNKALATRNKDVDQPVVLVRIKGLSPTRLLEPKVLLAS